MTPPSGRARPRWRASPPDTPPDVRRRVYKYTSRIRKGPLLRPYSGAMLKADTPPDVRRRVYKYTSLIRNQASLGPYSRTMPRAL